MCNLNSTSKNIFTLIYPKNQKTQHIVVKIGLKPTLYCVFVVLEQVKGIAPFNFVFLINIASLHNFCLLMYRSTLRNQKLLIPYLNPKYFVKLSRRGTNKPTLLACTRRARSIPNNHILITKKYGALLSVLVLEQVKGIEPSYQAWEARVLPLNYTCI